MVTSKKGIMVLCFLPVQMTGKHNSYPRLAESESPSYELMRLCISLFCCLVLVDAASVSGLIVPIMHEVTCYVDSYINVSDSFLFLTYC